MEIDRVGATLFDVFFAHWTRAVAAERFPRHTFGILAEGAAGLAAALLLEDRAGWFAPGRRQAVARAAFAETLDWLSERLGPDVSQWTWGRLHVLPLRHFLSGRGDLGILLDHGGAAVPGDLVTVCSAGGGAAFEARSGAGYRMIVDLASSPPALWAVDAQSQSGHPGSPHYDDQLADWLAGRYHRLTLAAGPGEQAVSILTLLPVGQG
jgi:penicillin amidase